MASDVAKRKYFHFRFFLRFCKKTQISFFAFVVSKIKARCGPKMAIYQMLLFKSSPNSHVAFGYIWGHNFWTNYNLDPLSTSKCPSEPQFCERWRHMWQKNGQKRSYNSYKRVTFISEHSLVLVWWGNKLKPKLCWQPFFYFLQLLFIHACQKFDWK